MITRKYLYGIAGIVVAAGLLTGGVILVNNKDDAATKPTDSVQTANESTDAEVKPVTSNEIKTPTNNDELSATLSDDASSIDTNLRNYENNDYADRSLTDDSLYN